MILPSIPITEWPPLPPLAHDGWELATWIVIALVVLVLGIYRVVLVLGIYRKDLRAVLDQVKNSHETNLRDDVDGVGDRIDDVLDRLEEFGRDLRGMRSDIGGLRGGLREERKDRLAFEHQVTEKLRAIADDTGAIREQTENDHESNMRVDIDKVLSGITRIEMRQNQQANGLQEVRKEVRRDIGGLREEMRTERTERAEADKQTRQMIQQRPH